MISVTKSLKKTGMQKDGRLATCLMLSPAVFLLIICSIYPVIWVFRYILFNYNGFKATYTGMRNIQRMFSDTTFWNSVVHTFEYAGLKLIFILPLALLMAVLLSQRLRGSSLFRGIYFMPTVISTAISGMIFTFIFATGNGILNAMLKSIGLIGKPIGWLIDQSIVMSAITILSVWGGFGNYLLYFSAGMSGIPEDVYESAKIDGANGAQTFLRITLPMLAPVLKVVLMLAVTGAFKDYEAIMVLTNGGPGNRSSVMFLYIYKLIFYVESGKQAQIGYGALLSLAAGIIVGVATCVCMRITRKLDDIV